MCLLTNLIILNSVYKSMRFINFYSKKSNDGHNANGGQFVQWLQRWRQELRKDNQCFKGQLTPSVSKVVVLRIQKVTFLIITMARYANADFRLTGQKEGPVISPAVSGTGFHIWM